MKIVMTFTTTDGCSYSDDHTICIEYKSTSSARSDFITACKGQKRRYKEFWKKARSFKNIRSRIKYESEHLDMRDGEFTFCGHIFNFGDFIDTRVDDGSVIEVLPTFQELNDWFDNHKR